MTGRENYMRRELHGWLGRAWPTCLWSYGEDLREVGIVKGEKITVRATVSTWCMISTWYSPAEDVNVHSKEMIVSLKVYWLSISISELDDLMPVVSNKEGNESHWSEILKIQGRKTSQSIQCDFALLFQFALSLP